MLAFKQQPAVNLIRKHHDVAIAYDLGNVMDILFAQDPAGGILR